MRQTGRIWTGEIISFREEQKKYLVVNVAILGLHDMNGAHLGIRHPLDIVRLTGLGLRVIVLRVV